VSRSKKQLKPEPQDPEEEAPPRERLSGSDRQFGSSHAHFDPSRVKLKDKNPPRAVSVWLDLLTTALWVGPAVGILAYFVGVLAAIAIASAIIVALALCLNSAIEHTIELDHTNLAGRTEPSRNVSNGSRSKRVESKF